MLIPSEQDFAAAVALWREWNSRINVISRKDEDAIFAHHILHSLAIAQYLELYYPAVGGIPPEGRNTRGSIAGGPARWDGGVSPKGELPTGVYHQPQDSRVRGIER